MLNFFTSVIEYIQICFNFLITTITGLVNALLTLVTSLGSINVLAGSVPFFISSSIFISLFIVIINYIIGRSNQ